MQTFTVSSLQNCSSSIITLRYEQDYSFLANYHHGKVREEMGNGERKVAG